jgi:hypothetical protein
MSRRVFLGSICVGFLLEGEGCHTQAKDHIRPHREVHRSKFDLPMTALGQDR